MKFKSTLFAAALLFAAQGAFAAHITYDCATEGGTGCSQPIPTTGTSGTISSFFTLTTSGTIADVDVLLDLTHTFDDDLDISLTHGGVTIDLSSDNGGSGDNYTNTIFDDEATTSITDGTAPFTGSYIPEELLSAFDGLDIAGLWTLTIVDDVGGDTGFLNSWGLAIAAAGPAPAPEPGILLLLGMGLAGLGFARRRS